MSTCLTRRPLPAPMALRMANSLRRAADLASSRFATFAHAMSRTKATAPSSISRAGRTSPTRSSRTVTIAAPLSLFSFGYSRASAPAMVLISAWACSNETPGLRRPRTDIPIDTLRSQKRSSRVPPIGT